MTNPVKIAQEVSSAMADAQDAPKPENVHADLLDQYEKVRTHIARLRELRVELNRTVAELVETETLLTRAVRVFESQITKSDPE